MIQIIYWPAALSSALACFVEMVEALTIVLAVGALRGWRTALAGAFAAAILLAAIIALGGTALRHVDLRPFQIVIGSLLLIFGMRWLRKAILRASGHIAMHDEDKIYRDEVASLSAKGSEIRAGIDIGGAMTSFQGVLIEGLEVVFIVIAVGSTAVRLQSASLGAGAAFVSVLLLGLILRVPLSKIPENSLKFLVGVMLMSLGTVWTGEGIGLTWPGGDAMLIYAALIYAAIAFAMVAILRKPKAASIA